MWVSDDARVLRVHFPPEPPRESLMVGLPVLSQHSDPRSLCRGLTGHPRRSMSLIENSEIFLGKRSCENADNVTITTILPTFKKKPGIFQNTISHYRGDETALHAVREAENRCQGQKTGVSSSGLTPPRCAPTISHFPLHTVTNRERRLMTITKPNHSKTEASPHVSMSGIESCVHDLIDGPKSVTDVTPMQATP